MWDMTTRDFILRVLCSLIIKLLSNLAKQICLYLRQKHLGGRVLQFQRNLLFSGRQFIQEWVELRAQRREEIQLGNLQQESENALAAAYSLSR